MFKKPSRNTLQGCLAVTMACFALAPLGHITTLANMVPYLVSYMRKHTDAKAVYSLAIWLSCGLHATQGISTPLTAALLPKIGYRPLLIVSWIIHNVQRLARIHRKPQAQIVSLQRGDAEGHVPSEVRVTNRTRQYIHSTVLVNGVASVEPFFSRHQTDYSRAPVFTAFFFSFLRSLGILVTGVTLNVGFGAVIFTYAIMVGYGIGASYGLLLSVAASWFPKHRGLIVGICACGFGAGAIILTPIQTYIINPGNIAVNNVTQEPEKNMLNTIRITDNLLDGISRIVELCHMYLSCRRMFEDEAMLDRVPKCLYIIGGIMAGFQLIGCIFAHPRPEKSDSVIEGTSEETPEDVLGRPQLKTVVAPDEEVSLTPSQVMRESNIFIFWTIMFLSLVPLTLITASLKVNDKYLSTVNTIGAVFNTLARIAWGPVGDVFSYKMPLCCLNVFYGFILVTLPYIPSIPGAGKQLYAIWVILTFICIAGNFVLLPFGISRAFGHKYFAANYGIVFSAFTPGSITGALIVYFVKLEYCLKEIFIACGIICLCSKFLHGLLATTQAQRVS
ncbi:unnamed protein product [Mesocestoides corti]|uniref:Major facilitator superfamily (MFS) profile domain-containing protein n=1 Tax=Mesocestoides corti TaxID=53468 RepID=A0A0R3UL99_MESCO|nr:unnamed protein product [Mesocestoides corti]